MHLDVVDLREFYDTRLGQIARRHVMRPLRSLWPDVRGLCVLGLGFATPYLSPFLGEAERVTAIMPAQQGVMHWPREGPNRVALAHEGELPLPDASFDRVLLVHSLETSESVRPLLRQVWRVMANGGRLAVIAPNRSSLWAQFETTPFGHGHPYTRTQLSRLLRDCLFAPEVYGAALRMPPFSSRLLVRTGSAWERTGAALWNGLSGVHIVEATKQLYAVTPTGSRAPVTERVRVLRPVRGVASAKEPTKD